MDREKNRNRSRFPPKGKVIVNEVCDTSKQDDNNSSFGDDKWMSWSRPVAMVILGGYPIEGGES